LEAEAPALMGAAWLAQGQLPTDKKKISSRRFISAVGDGEKRNQEIIISIGNRARKNSKPNIKMLQPAC
jgi:hypothetical protein